MTALVFALALGLTACGGGAGGASGNATELTVGIPSGITTINPATDNNGAHHFFRYLAYEPILKRDPATGEFGPALAEEFGFVGEGNTVYEFTLREDAQFSDGTPLDGAAVKEWFEYFQKTSVSFGSQLPLTSVTVKDDGRTIRLELSRPTPTVELYLSGANWAYVSQVDPARMEKEMLGAGPYVYDSAASVEGDSYVFTASENYYDKSVQHYEKVTVKVIDSPNAMLSSVRSGEIDMALGSTATAEAAEAADGVDVFHTAAGWSGFEVMDLAGKEVTPLGDVRVRQALSYAIDRETITTALMGEYSEPTSAWLPLDVPEVDEESKNYYEYDPEKAKTLLAEAGYPDGFTLPVLTMGWEGNAGTPMAQAVAAGFEEIGVELKITPASTSGEYYAKILAGEVPFSQLVNTGAPAYVWAAGRWTSWATLNFFGNDTTESEKQILELATAPQDQAVEKSNELTQFVVENAYMIPVFSTSFFVYTNSDKVTGVTDDNVTQYLPWSPFILEAEPR